MAMKCKYCGHRVRSLSVYDSFHWKYKRMGIVYTHIKHDYNSIKCAVKGCNCKSPIPTKKGVELQFGAKLIC